MLICSYLPRSIATSEQWTVYSALASRLFEIETRVDIPPRNVPFHSHEHLDSRLSVIVLNTTGLSSKSYLFAFSNIYFSQRALSWGQHTFRRSPDGITANPGAHQKTEKTKLFLSMIDPPVGAFPSDTVILSFCKRGKQGNLYIASLFFSGISNLQSSNFESSSNELVNNKKSRE